MVISLSKLLSKPQPISRRRGKVLRAELEALQLKMLRVQQGIWHRRQRAVIIFEGFDASGKGGVIRRLTEAIDPRGFQVHPIGPPTSDELEQHYLNRFWKRLPPRGTIGIFDRSWYGRVLVERVDGLTPPERWRQAYREINEFESALISDGIDVIKIFLAIDSEEQMHRFEGRLLDPYKQWKLSESDVRARAKWDSYVKATDDMLARTHSKRAPWHLIAANDKHRARHQSLSIVTRSLAHHAAWIEEKAQREHVRNMRSALRETKSK